MNKNFMRAVEWAKTALIIMLTLSALLLGRQTRMFSDLFASIPIFGSVAELMRGTAGSMQADGTAAKEAARPLSIAITYEDGGRFGVRYDTDTRNTVYNMTSGIIGEALGSSAKPFEISEEHWREALTGAGVFFEYASPLKLSVLDGWLGVWMTDIEEDMALRRVFVAIGGGRNRIFFQEYNSGLFFSADTASSAGKTQEMGIFNANGALFAFETGIPELMAAPYVILMPDMLHPVISPLAAGSPEELLDTVIGATGHRNETNRIYYDGSVLVCVGTQFNIRIEPDGQAIYRRTDGFAPANDGGEFSEGRLIEDARVIAENTIGVSGEAEVFFESVEYISDSIKYVTFGYYIAGGRVHLRDDRHAIKITFVNGMLTEAELFFRNYTVTGDYIGLLPEKQTLAAAGHAFMLSYYDTGLERLLPFWVKE